VVFARTFTGPRRGLTVLAAAIVALVGTGTSASAGPSISQLESQISQSWNSLEPVVEQYNLIHAQLQQNQAKAAVLEQQIRPLRLQVNLALTRVDAMSASLYESGPVTGFGALLASGSPTTLADQLLALDQVARRRAATVHGAADLVARYTGQKQRLDTIIATQTQQDKELAAKKASIQAQMDSLQKLRQQAYGASGNAGGTIKPVACPYELTGGKGGIAAKAACAQVGKPYKWAAAGPDSFDCSGITMFAWAAAGVNLRHYTKWQWADAKPVSRNELQPGDLVFYFNDVHHMSIYVGGDWVVHAPTTGDVVRMTKLDNPYLPIEGFRRPG
jgi:cell wall-associated NlpC family hydrolase